MNSMNENHQNHNRFSFMPTHTTRIIAYLVTAATFAAGMQVGHFSQMAPGVIAFALTYPWITTLVSKRFCQEKSDLVNTTLILTDGLITGVIMVLAQFSVVPSIMFLVVIYFNSMVTGGIKIWLGANAAMIIGIVAGISAVGLDEYLITTPKLVTIVVGIGSGIYIAVAAYYANNQTTSLINTQLTVQQQNNEAAALSQKLSKYLPPQVWSSIFAGSNDAILETQRKRLTVFFSDIKGFVNISEELEPEALTELLNSYFTEMSNIAHEYGGTIDKFIGDSIMIFFGDPTSKGIKEDSLAAVSMAIAMRKHMKVLRQQWRSFGVSSPIEIRMGINTGYCTVGNFGATSRMDYTIIGKEVNLASRLEALTQPSEILISETTHALVRDKVMCRDKGQISVKGFSKPISIYQIVDFRTELGSEQSFIEHETEGFAMYLDTNKVRNYDKEKIIKALEMATQKIKDSLPLS
ncbi:MAG TPA: adenylate/guanylate cyclase domain-containing protein [Pseudomonadales bacterium]